MTNTDIANIVKPLEWEITRIGDGMDMAVSGTRCMGITVYETEWRIGYGSSYPDAFANGECKSLEDGMKQAEEAYQKISLENIDDTKLQQQEPFWKPIEQCPKEVGQEYLLRDDTDKYVIAIWNDRYSEWSMYNGTIYHDDELTHYAEIPPCEVQS